MQTNCSIPEEWREIRKSILERDGKACRCCKRKSKLTVHHIITREDGGLDDARNLITLCDSCHDLAELDQLTFEQYANGYLFKLNDYPKTYIAVGKVLKYIGRSFFNGKAYEIQRERPHIVLNWKHEIKEHTMRKAKPKVTVSSKYSVESKKSANLPAIKGPEIKIEKQTKPDEIKSVTAKDLDYFVSSLRHVRDLESRLGLSEYKLFEQEIEYWRRLRPQFDFSAI